MGILKNHLSTSTTSTTLAPASPIIRSPLRERFSEYFHHSFDPILNQSGQGWKTIKHPLDEGQIWQAWQDGDRLIGLGFGKLTRYALVDIDADSIYHTEEGLRDIRWALEAVGINETVLIRSSYSQGWHLYFAFSEFVPTFGLSCLLHSAMDEAGLIIAKGTLELFPNRKGWQPDAVTVYNRHRLPLQPAAGSALLDKDLQPYSTDLGTFLNRLDDSAKANDSDLIKQLAAEAKANYNPSKKKAKKTTGTPFTPHNPNARQWKKNLETAIANGWDGHHQSNILLGQIAEYGRVFLGFDDEHQLANYIATTAMAAPGFIPYCRHAKEINAWSLRWARSAIRHRYPYGSRRGGEFKQLGKGGPTNEEKHSECLGRVADAVADYQESGREWPCTIHARRKLIARMANCSERTLIKPDYLPLWHPNFSQGGDRDAVAVANGCNAHAVRNSATQDTTGSHPNNNCVLLWNSFFSSFRQHVLARGSILTIEVPQALIQSGIQETEEKTASEFVPIAGAWMAQPDRPHILLRIQEIDTDGIWCRCQDAQAPLAIADEDAHHHTTPPEEQT